MGIEVAFKKSTSEETLDNFGSDLKDAIGNYMYITSMSMQMIYETPYGFHFIPNNNFVIDSVKIIFEKYREHILHYVLY